MGYSVLPRLCTRHSLTFVTHGVDTFQCRFQDECNILSLAKHPNVVQYLATYYDPDTQLSVLLMEHCDENLTVIREKPLSYHIQLHICNDIALALVYLYSIGLIHRDLTGPRAKVTDFGTSKLATVKPHMKASTRCPDNVLYMPPEALDASKSYTTKLLFRCDSNPALDQAVPQFN